MTDDVRYQKILAAVRAVPEGRVSSYGRIAADAGLPGRARLVGKVLADAKPEDALPWHRILRADGRLAFPPGSDGFERQSRRLAREGVEVSNGRVQLKTYGIQVDLDEWLWRR